MDVGQASAKQLPTIRQLSASVVNKIAAGEVIERPGSVVKELLENAVDAGATQITLELDKGGLERIRISDNGCGIVAEQLPLAVASHATSKIEDADDLFRVGTLGFRGEALASIAEVSQMRIRSRCGDDHAGYELSINGGQKDEVAPCACAVGTSIEIQNLFFNTPVRRKFLRTVPTEFSHATEAFSRIALAFHHVHFSLMHNGRVVHDLPPVTDWHARIASLFGPEVSENLLQVANEHEGYGLRGYVGNPVVSRSNNKMQYLFLNGRHIKDRALQHALSEAYRGLLLTGRYPICFLRLELPADEVDVNVHPSKLEVRFQDAGRVYSQLLGTLRSCFLSSDLTAHVRPHPTDTTDATDAADASADTSTHAGHASVSTSSQPIAAGNHESSDGSRRDHQADSSDRDRGRNSAGMQPLAPWAGSPEASGIAAESDSPERITRRDDTRAYQLRDAAYQVARTLPGYQQADGRSLSRDVPSAESTGMWTQSNANADVSYSSSALQAHNRYLVTACEEGLMVIDQHALHERILYEQLREKVLSGSVEIQRLLTPEPVDLAPVEAAAMLQQREVLAEMGILVDAFGGSTVLCTGYPAMLQRVNTAELIQHVAHQLTEGLGKLERRDVIDEILHMCSCKAAVKAGDPLAKEEVDQLLAHRHLVQDSHHCPHGRPTTLVFTREELDRRFQR